MAKTSMKINGNQLKHGEAAAGISEISSAKINGNLMT